MLTKTPRPTDKVLKIVYRKINHTHFKSISRANRTLHRYGVVG